MPRPPMLPVIDFKDVHKNGLTYKKWLAIAEKKENVEKMETLRKSIVLEPGDIVYLQGIPRAVNVLAIAEDWCGDVHRHIPALEALAAATPKVRVRYISRADRPDVFARYLTNGGEAIPKIVFFSDKFVECGNWGPMPTECRRLVSRGKAAGDVPSARKRVSAIYDSDPNCEMTISEFLDLIAIAVCTTP